MNYHNVTKQDMLNGSGLRTVLWVAGCNHNCKGCQNPITHDPNGGLPFTDEVLQEIIEASKDTFISGLTFSGGDPLFPDNRETVTEVAKKFKEVYPNKTIWLYTGYTFEEIKNLEILRYIDVVVDGEFILDLRDVNLPWKGSSNQRVIDVKKSTKDIVLFN